MKRFGLQVLAGFVVFILAASVAAQETASFSPAHHAPQCVRGVSPCHVPGSLINGRDNISGGEEPNQPNTISTSPCADGTSGVYHSDYESLDSFSVVDLSGDKFLPGDTVKVEAVVYCYNTTDRLTVYVSPNTVNPSWTDAGDTPCTVSGSTETLEVTFNLPSPGGNQVVRAAFTYGTSGSACESGSYNDRDDVVISVGDSDHDGMGDDFENSTQCVEAGSRDAWEDPDNDGISNLEEFIQGTDPCDPDTDGDGMDDYWEMNNGTDPLTNDAAKDDDVDGLDNLGEYLAGCDPALADTDAGGVSDADEVQAGTDCTSALDDYQALIETVGNSKSWDIGETRIYGNFYEVSKATVLTGFEQYLLFSTPYNYRPLVYEGNTPGQSFTKIFETTLAMDDTGSQWFESGDLYVILRPGKTYFIGMGYDLPWGENSRAYARYDDTSTVSVHFGEINYGGSISKNWPPPQSYSISASDLSRYYQKVETCTIGCFPKNAALIRDSQSWADANTSVMNDFGVPYTLISNTEISSADYSLYDKIIIESKQEDALYAALENDSERINAWVEQGGDLDFHGADNSPYWYGNYTIPPEMEGVSGFSDKLTVQLPAHWSVIGVTSAGIDDWKSSAHGEISATATTPANVITADTTGGPVLSTFQYGQGDVSFSTMTLEYGADPSGIREEAKALHRNLILHEEKPLDDCGPASSQTIADTGGGTDGTTRYRGTKYRVDTSALLIEFKQKIDPEDGSTLQFAVFEADTESETYTKIWERLRYAGDKTPSGYYSSGPVNIRLKTDKYYVFLTGWNASTYYYYVGSPGFPFDTGFGQALGGAYSNSFPVGASQSFTTSSTGYSQQIVTQPFDRCRLADSDGDGLSDSYESNFSKTDKYAADSDGDGMPDAWELTFLLDPNSDEGYKDSDGDGLINLKEYAFSSNPFLPDIDADGMADGWEVSHNICMDLHEDDSL
ncbi:MAG: hypothetical protein R6V10_13060, partial [bacterium]